MAGAVGVNFEAAPRADGGREVTGIEGELGGIEVVDIGVCGDVPGVFAGVVKVLEIEGIDADDKRRGAGGGDGEEAHVDVVPAGAGGAGGVGDFPDVGASRGKRGVAEIECADVGG